LSGVPASTPAERRTAEAAVLVVMAFWAGNFIVVKSAITVLPPVVFTSIRYAVAALTLLALLRWREGDIRLPRRDIVPIAILGVVGFALYQFLWTYALQSVSAGDSALIIASSPVLTALIAVVAGSDVLTPGKLAGGIVSLAGVALVIGAGQGLGVGSELTGQLITLAAAVCWAIYSAFGAPFLRRHTPLRTTAWAIAFGATALAPLAVLQSGSVAPGALGPEVVVAILYSATLAAGLANVVVSHGVKLLGPTRITALQTLVPAMAVVLAAIFLHEPIRLPQVLGGAVILAGVALTRSDGLASARARVRGRV
jgi:drug/metabolite transporter (DMT)-like permease